MWLSSSALSNIVQIGTHDPAPPSFLSIVQSNTHPKNTKKKSVYQEGMRGESLSRVLVICATCSLTRNVGVVAVDVA